ncbi:MAG: UDP-N-acetylmuramate--L-alanine ligase [Bacteroidetes bacterium]|nr:UDP-N-acetylmuramate--L-alanine ligase [Bacteroidota bacterium]
MGGSGMRALAAMLLQHGAAVSGSDGATSGALDRLAEQGASVHIGQRPENIPSPCDLVVYSAAIDAQNPELLAARQGGCDVLKYAQMLGRLMAEKVGIAIAGTHGKSTTTAMVATVLQRAGVDPSFIVGATVEQLGGPSGVGAGRHFLAEACEFDRSFLNLCPHDAAILNVEEDHLDCYRDLRAIIEAFRAFAARLPVEGVLVVNGDDRNATEAATGASCDVETVGLSDACHWQGTDLATDRGRVRMTVRKQGEAFGELLVPLAGTHNAYNALVAMALLHHAGIDAQQMIPLLETFTGAHRRMMLKARIDGVTIVDDFAHHPTEIQASLRAMADAYDPGRILCLFQPHQHSRTRFLLKDFAASFALADEVIVPEIYFVRDSQQERDHISSEDLVAQLRLRGGKAVHLETFEAITDYVMDICRPGDLVVTMGAGNVWEIADELVHRLGP